MGDEFMVDINRYLSMLKNFKDENPGKNPTKDNVCAYYKVGDREWRHFYRTIEWLEDQFEKQYEMWEKENKLQGNNEEKWKQAHKMFQEQYGISPYWYQRKQKEYIQPSCDEKEYIDNQNFLIKLKGIDTNINEINTFHEEIIFPEIKGLSLLFVGKLTRLIGSGENSEQSEQSEANN